MNKLKAKNTFYNDPMYDVVVDSRMLEQHLKEKDQQIAELQKQLEEKDADIIALDTDNYSFKQQIDSLRQQLKSQPAEIVGKIRSKCCVEDKCKDGSFVLGINEKDLDTILKEYGGKDESK